MPKIKETRKKIVEEKPVPRPIPKQQRPVPKQTVPENPTPNSPTVRLVISGVGKDKNGKDRGDTKAKILQNALSPTIRLAHVPGAQGDNNLIGQRGVEQLPEGSRPALLISYYYLDNFLSQQEKYAYRDWVMDSGAFSAESKGIKIDVMAYITKCKELMEKDKTLTEIYALDVIGDWKASLKNTEIMWKHGVPAIPCFHYGEPWDVLLGLAKDYPKIAIGGCVGRRDKDKFAAQCFARVWPKKCHGFGFGAESSLMKLPWHSVDATNWEMGPCAFGRWACFGNAAISVRGSSQNLRAEVEFYLDLEKRARERWKKEMVLLESQDAAPTVRFVVGTGRSKKEEGINALNGD
jgi:hypothetical protein